MNNRITPLIVFLSMSCDMPHPCKTNLCLSSCHIERNLVRRIFQVGITELIMGLACFAFLDFAQHVLKCLMMERGGGCCCKENKHPTAIHQHPVGEWMFSWIQVNELRSVPISALEHTQSNSIQVLCGTHAKDAHPHASFITNSDNAMPMKRLMMEREGGCCCKEHKYQKAVHRHHAGEWMLSWIQVNGTRPNWDQSQYPHLNMHSRTALKFYGVHTP